MTVPSWHHLCTLREDVRQDTLRLDEFAADLNDVRTGAAPVVYREPLMFFDRTYPTHRMKVLARDVLRRLAGQTGRPVLRLQVAYGGGKTHTLITLLHLAERGVALSSPLSGGTEGGHHTVHEFMTFAGLPQLTAARVALLPGDKLDVKKGLEVYGPTGQTRRVKTLWGALAYQLAGEAGYAHLQSHDEEFTVPAEPLLVDLLRAPVQEGVGALVLVDEAVWYYRSAVNYNPRALGTIKDFYQVLTQAVTKVERAAMVASLMASKVEANDQTGAQCLAALDEVFQRIAEPVEPVAREDVTEVLRRRLFEQVPGEAERRPSVDAVMAAMSRLPLRETQQDQSAYQRWLGSYPFHPDLIEVLYQKWTQMSGFQRTRGALRLLAYALRDSAGHDPSPFIGPVALLSSPISSLQPSAAGLSSALNELIEVCDESDKWRSILTGELAKAREIQAGLPTLAVREVEQAVIATFLHSQPLGQRAAPSDLLALLAHPTLDAAALEEGLRKWRQLSWFLIEDPNLWQLGTTPNLTHMHLQAKGWLDDSEIEQELEKRVRAVPTLKAADPGVEVYTLPPGPHSVDDNLSLHYLILGPECAIELGKPLPQAVEAYFNQKTGPHDPRIYRNNILALAPEFSSVAGLRERVRDWLAWDRLEQSDLFKLMTDRQKKQVPDRKKEAVNNLPESVVGAYRVLVAVDETGQVIAQSLRADPSTVGGAPFERIKAMLAEEERLVTTTLDPDLILPGSYLELWGKEQTTRRVIDLIAAFGQFPRLPRLLSPESLYDTLTRGVRKGMLALRLPRSDGSVRTWWRIPPDADTLRRKELEIQPVYLAELHQLEADLLVPETLTGLWPTPAGPVKLADLHAFFDGQRAPRLANSSVLDEAVRAAVKMGKLMARLDGNTLFKEDLPSGSLPSTLELLPPPAPLRGADLTAQALPQAWSGDQANLQAMAEALAAQRGYLLPWTLLTQAVDEALSLRLFEHIPASGPWPCSPVAADQVGFRLVEKIELTPDTIISAVEYTASQTPTLQDIKETIEHHFFGGRQVPADLFQAQVKIAINQGKLKPVEVGASPDSLASRVRLPDVALYGDATLDAAALQSLAEQIAELLTIAPHLAFSFRVAITAEGQKPDPALLQRLNVLLEEIKPGWRLE